MELTNTLNFAKNPFRFFYRKSVPIAHQGRLYHMHQGMELLYVHHGNGRALIENQIIDIGPGTLLFYPPFQVHGIMLENNEPGALIRSVFEFDPLAIEPYVKPFSTLQQFYYRLWKNQPVNVVMACRIDPDGNWSAQIERELALLDSVRNTGEYEDHYALTVLSVFKSVQPYWTKQFESPVIGSRPQTSAEVVMEWIDAHFNEPFTMEALSKVLHLSDKHISTLFRKTTGIRVTEYLMAKRLKEACKLLISTTDSVEHITFEVGLTNVSYFCQFFKKRLGMTPFQFRKQHTNSF